MNSVDLAANCWPFDMRDGNGGSDAKRRRQPSRQAATTHRVTPRDRWVARSSPAQVSSAARARSRAVANMPTIRATVVQ